MGTYDNETIDRDEAARIMGLMEDADLRPGSYRLAEEIIEALARDLVGRPDGTLHDDDWAYDEESHTLSFRPYQPVDLITVSFGIDTATGDVTFHTTDEEEHHGDT